MAYPQRVRKSHGIMIQEIFPKQFYNSYDPKKRPDEKSSFTLFSGESVLVRGEGEAELPGLRDISRERAEKSIYLFSIDDKSYFLVEEDGISLPGFHYRTLAELRRERGREKSEIFAMMTARHLRTWYRNNRFCGVCGRETVYDTVERAKRCLRCGNVIYPKIMPAVIVAVTDPVTGRMLVTKYANRPFSHYALIAGFTEIGETLEETVQREVREEVGIEVKNIRYYKSQPWGIAGDLLAGFQCEVEGSAEITLDENELKLAEWKLPEEMELQPDDFSLTNEMMANFKYHKNS